MAQQASGARSEAAARQRSAEENWLRTQSSTNTRAAYRSDLQMFGAWCAREGAIPLTADRRALIAFQAAREAAGDTDSTIRRRWSALSSFYDYAVAHQLRSVNPSDGIERPKVTPGDPSPTMQLSEAAVASYRAAAAALDPRLDALVNLLVCDGLKVVEALALDVEDVGRKAAATTITLRRRGETKRIVLQPDSARAVRQCIGKRRAGPVFVSERATGTTAPPHRLTRFGADHLIRQLRDDSTSVLVTANALRRFHITSHRRAGTTLDDVRDRAGLANVRDVKRYVDRTDETSDSTRSR
jgi:integrase/recombinase XerD